jgi:hypothetical protein
MEIVYPIDVVRKSRVVHRGHHVRALRISPPGRAGG